MGRSRVAAVVVAVAVVLGVVACEGTAERVPVATEERESTPLPIDRGPAQLPRPDGDVRVAPGDDLQTLIDAYPEDTTFLLTSGIHRGYSVIPRDGQVFRGEVGTVVSGAVALDPGSFRQDDRGRWYVDGQTQQGHARGEVLPGRERDIHPEEVFVDGDRPLRHAISLSDLDAESFFFDYDVDRIYLGTDPSTFSLIETSVLPYAFAGTGVRDVVIRNLVVEKYASAYQWGALGGDDRTRYTLGWTFEDLEVRYNHAGGLLLGPGATVRRVWSHHNGQHGMGGNGTDPYGNAALVTVTDSRISHNLRLGFDWSHEGGGTKFSLMQGMVFARNHVHDNAGPGVWWDVFNRDVSVTDNLVVDNEQMGIFYEISYGDTLIADNVVLRNGLVDGRVGIEVTASSGVTVSGNHVAGNGGGIGVVHDGSRYRMVRAEGDSISVEDVVVRANVVSMDQGFNGFGVFDDDDSWYDEVVFEANRYHLPASPDAVNWVWDDVRTIDQWFRAHPEDGPVLEAIPPPPPAVLALAEQRVGPR